MLKDYSMLTSQTAPAAVALALGLVAAPNHVSAATTYAAINGNNSSSCVSPLSPCLTISAAMSKAVAGGGLARVVVIGTGVFHESVNPSAPNGFEIVGADSNFATIEPPSGTTGIEVNIGSSEARISNIQILGDSGGAYGVKIDSVHRVYLDNVQIFGMSTAAIYEASKTSPFSVMALKNSTVGRGNNCLVVRPTVVNNINIMSDNTVFRACNGTAILLDSSTVAPDGSGNIQANIRRTDVEDGGTMIEALSASGSGNVALTVENSAVWNNSNGVVSQGPASVVRLNNVSIANCGVGITTSGGGIVDSYTNNDLGDNYQNLKGSLTKIPLQ